MIEVNISDLSLWVVVSVYGFYCTSLRVLIEMRNSKNLFDVISSNNYEMSEYYCNAIVANMW